MNYKKLYNDYGEFNILYNQLSLSSPSVEYSWRRTKKILQDQVIERIEKADVPVPISIVDIGCGNGALLIRLALMFAHKKDSVTFTGIDISDTFIKYANNAKLYKKLTNITFKQVDIEKEILPQNSSIVISSEVLEHLVYPAEFLKNVYTSLLPGGYFLLTTPNATNIIKYPLNHLKKFIQQENNNELVSSLSKKEHTFKLAEHEQHLHVYNYRELFHALTSCGFVIKSTPRSTTFFGGAFLDNNPLLFAGTIIFDSIMHLMPLPQLGWDSIFICQKPR